MNLQFDRFGFMPPSESSLGQVFRSLDKNFTAAQRRFNVPPSSVRVSNSVVQTIPNTTFTALTFDTVIADTNKFHNSITPTRLTCNEAGMYQISGVVGFVGSAGGTVRYGALKLNGATYLGISTILSNASTSQAWLTPSTPFYLNVGDYVEFHVYQDTGAGLDILVLPHASPELAMVLY